MTLNSPRTPILGQTNNEHANYSPYQNRHCLFGCLYSHRVQGTDKNVLVRDGSAHALEFGQFAAGRSQLFQDGRALEALWPQQLFKRLEGHLLYISGLTCIDNSSFLYVFAVSCKDFWLCFRFPLNQPRTARLTALHARGRFDDYGDRPSA